MGGNYAATPKSARRRARKPAWHKTMFQQLNLIISATPFNHYATFGLTNYGILRRRPKNSSQILYANYSNFETRPLEITDFRFQIDHFVEHSQRHWKSTIKIIFLKNNQISMFIQFLIEARKSLTKIKDTYLCGNSLATLNHPGGDSTFELRKILGRCTEYRSA